METVNDTDPPTGTPPPYPRPERLTRATDDKVVGGVAGGLGRYFGIDPVVFRIAFVVLALAGGSGILLYLLGWLLVPDDTGAVALPRVGRERNQKLLAAVLAGGGILILLNQLTSRGHGDVPAGVVLVAIGALILWSRRDHDSSGGSDRRTPPPPPAPLAPPPPGAPPTPADEVAPTLPVSTGTGPEPPAVTPTEAKPRSAVVPVTLSLLAVLAGGLALLGVSPATGLALALLLTGAALVLGAWRGRARWLIPVGLVLVVALAAVSVIDVPVRGGAGDARFRPTGIDDIRSPYRLAAGDLTLDLRDLDLQGATVTVVASVAVGDLTVLVPDGAGVEVDAHIGAGDLALLGRKADGLDVTRQISEPGREGGGRLVLRTRAGLGLVEVTRAGA